MPNDIKNQNIDDAFSGLEVSPEKKVSEPDIEKPQVKPALPDLVINQEPKVEAPTSVEVPKSQEKVNDIGLEETSQNTEKPPVITSAKASTVPVPAPVLPTIYPKVEKILEEDLADVYFKLSPEKKKEFKEKGEETTLKISQLLQNTKIKVKQIFKLIINWLNIIPGVNTHFLEQEAKIKTDKLLIERDKELRK